jgi:hypothetical protein
MNNNFERFIQQNRKDFDTEQPSENVWDKIEQTIPVKKEAKRFSMNDIIKWSAAAAVLFIALTSVYFLYIKKYSHETQTAETGIDSKPGSVKPEELEGIAPEYAVQFKRFNESIETQQEELKKATSDQPSLYKQFEEDLKVLDSSFIALKNQAEHTPNRDVLIKAMIQNLQLQAELLGRQLLIMKDIKGNKNTQNQTQKDEKTI